MECCICNLKMAAKIVKFVLKSAVAGGLIYATVKITNSAWMAPNYPISHFKDNRSFADVPFEQNGETSNPEIVKQTWNKGVKKVFHGLLVAPDAIKDLSDKAFTQLKTSYKNSK